MWEVGLGLPLTAAVTVVNPRAFEGIASWSVESLLTSDPCFFALSTSYFTAQLFFYVFNSLSRSWSWRQSELSGSSVFSLGESMER